MRICFIHNFAQHYRESIFVKLSQNYEIDFFLGDKHKDVRIMDLNKLTSTVVLVRNYFLIGPIYWQSSIIGSIFKQKYNLYIALGDYLCLTTWILLVVNKLRGVPTILWTHGWYGNESIAKKLVKRLFFKFAKHVLLYGNNAKKLMIREGFSPCKLTVIYNSLDFEKHNHFYNLLEKGLIESPYKSIFSNNNPVLIFIGRLTKRKRIDLLIMAIKHLKENGKTYNLVLVGDGEMKIDLQYMIEEYGLHDNVSFMGESYEESINSKLLYYADILVSPGHVGLAAIHAMSYGTPVITHDDLTKQAPEVESIIQGVTGQSFKYNDVNDLSKVLDTWYEISKNERETVRLNCRNEIEKHYNSNVQTGILKDVISKIC